MNKVAAKAALETTLESIEQALANDDKVQLIGFGTFSVVEKEARTGINPQTKEKIQIPARKVVKFKPAAELAKIKPYTVRFSACSLGGAGFICISSRFLYFFCSLRNCLGNCLNLIAGFYIRFYENRICAASRNRF